MKKQFIIIIIILSIIGVISWLVIWMQTPARGSVSLTSTTNKTMPPLHAKKLDGTYVSFQYGGEYSAQTEEAANNDLERHTLNASTHYNKQILASVVELPGGLLQHNGDYVYRQKSTGTYANRKFQVNGRAIDVWVKRDGTEQTAMVPKGDKAAVVSLVTGPGANVDLTTEMDTLLKTLEWKK
jgi:hypothetical protein